MVEEVPSFPACGHPRQRWALLSSVLCIAATACAAFACGLPHWAVAGPQHVGLWENCTRNSLCGPLDAGALPCSDFLQAVRILSPVGVAFSMLTALLAFALSLWHKQIGPILFCAWGACLLTAFTTTLMCFLLWLLLLGVNGCSSFAMDFCMWVQLAASILCAAASVGLATSRNQRLVPLEAELPVLPYVVLDTQDTPGPPAKPISQPPISARPFLGYEGTSPRLNEPIHSTTPVFSYP